MRLEPKFARVILKRIVEKVTKGGIIIAGDAKKQAKPIGEVIAVGPTADETIKVGSIVYFGKMAGAWINDVDPDKEYYIVQDEDILAEVHED